MQKRFHELESLYGGSVECDVGLLLQEMAEWMHQAERSPAPGSGDPIEERLSLYWAKMGSGNVKLSNAMEAQLSSLVSWYEGDCRRDTECFPEIAAWVRENKRLPVEGRLVPEGRFARICRVWRRNPLC